MFLYTLEYFIDKIMQYVLLMFRSSVCTDVMSDHIKLKCQHLWIPLENNISNSNYEN